MTEATGATGDLGRVLVTGADGFIGSHLVEALLQGGARVRAFTFYNALGSRGWLDSLPPAVTGELEVVAGDVRDASTVRAAVQGCDTVLHLAALIAIPYSYGAPDAYLETNVRGTLNVLQAARELGVRKLVHTSTSEVYGSAQYVPHRRGAPASGAVALRRLQGRRRRLCSVVLPKLRPAGRHHPTL